MYRVFALRNKGSTANEKFVVYKSEKETFVGFFARAGVPQSIIDKVTSTDEHEMTPQECFSLARRLRMTLTLRRVLWEQQRPERPGLARAGSFTKTLDKPLRDRLQSMSSFLERAASAEGCTVSEHLQMASNG